MSQHLHNPWRYEREKGESSAVKHVSLVYYERIFLNLQVITLHF